MPVTAPVHVALVGYGFVGKTFHAPLIASVDGLVLHSVVSSNPEAVHADFPEARVVPTLEAALVDPAVDLVVIATPNTLHAPQAHTALAAGRHVVVDKPFTVTVAEAREDVIAHATRAGRVLSVFHNRRWDSDFLTLRAVLHEGALGVVTQFESHFDRYRPDVRRRWREQAGPGAGLWFDLGPHLVDQALQLFGAPLGINADIAVQRDNAETDDYFHVQLRYPRLRVVLHGSALMAAHDLRYAVHGTRGSFMKQGLDSQEDALKAVRTPGDAHWGVDPRPGTLVLAEGDDLTSRTIDGPPGNYRAYYEGVRDAIRGTGPNPVPATDALQVMRLIEAGVQSSATRCEVPLR